MKLSNLVRRFRRWKYLLLTFRDYTSRLNRCVDVENVLLACAAGKRPPPTPDECRALALKLGVPDKRPSATPSL